MCSQRWCAPTAPSQASGRRRRLLGHRLGGPAAAGGPVAPIISIPEPSHRQAIGRAVDDYLTAVTGAVDALDRDGIARAAELLLDARARGNRVYLVGNGGSASTASHMASDLARAAAETDGPPLSCRCLSDNISVLSAWANDVGYDSVFELQLAQVIEPGDVLIAFSASGKSPNILTATELARARGAYVLAFSGFGGGPLAESADVAVVVASNDYGPVEDLHLLLNHLLVTVMRRLNAETGSGAGSRRREHIRARSRGRDVAEA